MDDEFRVLIEGGASSERVRPEMAAFQSFSLWMGIAIALQKGDIREEQFVNLEGVFFRFLQEFSRGFDVELTGSPSYDSFWEWLDMRIHRYIAITHCTPDPMQATKSLVDQFWDFACDGEPSMESRHDVWGIYQSVSLNAAKTIASYRLTKG